jgi:hypothetical protein
MLFITDCYRPRLSPLMLLVQVGTTARHGTGAAQIMHCTWMCALSSVWIKRDLVLRWAPGRLLAVRHLFRSVLQLLCSDIRPGSGKGAAKEGCVRDYSE